MAVLNLGLGGNSVIEGGLEPTASQRFEQDVLSLPEVRWLVLFEGPNDIGAGRDADTVAERLIEACSGFVERAHQKRIRVLGVPILPFREPPWGEQERDGRLWFSARPIIGGTMLTANGVSWLKTPRSPGSYTRTSLSRVSMTGSCSSSLLWLPSVSPMVA